MTNGGNERELPQVAVYSGLSVDSKLKTHSGYGTPLTIKWATEANEGEACEIEPRVNWRRVTILVSAFVIGLGAFGLTAWLLGQRLWFLDALLGGFVSCMWVQRWGEKHLGWRVAVDKEGLGQLLSVAEIKKRRLKYSVPGIAIGIGAVAGAAWLSGESNWFFEAVMSSLASYDVAVRLGERFRGLTTLDDLTMVRMREEMSPLGLSADDRVPITLKTATEAKAKR